MATGTSVIEIRKIENFLASRRSEDKELVPTYRNIYIVSDSKGRYLKNEMFNVLDISDVRAVTFLCRGGRNTADGVEFLEQQISAGHIKRDRSIVLFWHVTCDINTLKRPERYLQPKFENPGAFLDFLKPSLDKLVEIHRRTDGIDIGILESPPVFWSKWNELRHHPDWKSFDDRIMHAQIDLVNDYIRELNKELNYVSPKFILDCMETRKKKGSHQRISLTSVLFTDGVHPVSVVSQKWLYQIYRSVCIYQ